MSERRGWRGLGRAWWATMRAATRPPVSVGWPEERELLAPGARGSIGFSGSRCDGRGACVSACPTGCLTATERGLQLDRSACIGCGLCVEACPSGALRWSAVDELAAVAREALVVEFVVGPDPATG